MDLRAERAARRIAETQLAALRDQLTAKRNKQAVKFGPRSWLSRRPSRAASRQPALDPIAEDPDSASVTSQASLPRDLESVGRTTRSIHVALGTHEDSASLLRQQTSSDSLKLNGPQASIPRGRGACWAACMLAALALVTVGVVMLHERLWPDIWQPSVEAAVLDVYERSMDIALRVAVPGDVSYVVVRADAADAADVAPTGEEVFWVGAGRRNGAWGVVCSFDPVWLSLFLAGLVLPMPGLCRCWCPWPSHFVLSSVADGDRPAGANICASVVAAIRVTCFRWLSICFRWLSICFRWLSPAAVISAHRR